jgi:hypothetical protein
MINYLTVLKNALTVLPFRAFSYRSYLIACLLPVHLFSFCDFGEDFTKIKKIVKPFCSFSCDTYVHSTYLCLFLLHAFSYNMYPLFPFFALSYCTDLHSGQFPTAITVLSLFEFDYKSCDCLLSLSISKPGLVERLLL